MTDDYDACHFRTSGADDRAQARDLLFEPQVVEIGLTSSVDVTRRGRNFLELLLRPLSRKQRHG